MDRQGTATSFVVRTVAQSPVTVLEIAGELDVMGAQDLDQDLDERLRGTETHLVLDLSRLAFIDSTGLSSLTRVRRRLNRNRRRVALVAGAGAVRRAFEVTGLEHVFETMASVDEAVAALAGAPPIGR